MTFTLCNIFSTMCSCTKPTKTVDYAFAAELWAIIRTLLHARLEVKKFTNPMCYYGNLTSRKMADITSEVVVTISQKRVHRRMRNPEEWKKTTT